MISSEASASEFAIRSAITTVLPCHDASPNRTRPSDAPPACALDLAKGPPATARHPQRIFDRAPCRPSAFPRPVGQSRVRRSISTLVYHMLVFTANPNRDRALRHLGSERRL